MNAHKYFWLIALIMVSVLVNAQNDDEKLVYKLNIKEEITKAIAIEIYLFSISL